MLGWIRVLILPGIVSYMTFRQGSKEWKSGNKFGGMAVWCLSVIIVGLVIFIYWNTIRVSG